jgi:hypothetical protein
MKYDSLESLDKAVFCIGAEVFDRCVSVDILCMTSGVRSGLTDRTPVDLCDENGVMIARVDLLPDYKGDRNGYLGDVTLEFSKVKDD